MVATSCLSSLNPLIIRASISKPTPSSTSISQTNTSTSLPLRKIPGDYGLPFLGAVRDRLDFFYAQGRDEFFKSRIQKYNSTVFRVNMPPGPFIAGDPRVIALLDAVSFPILFNTSLVEKKDLFTGTYMPSTDLTGGHRVLSYLDPSEPKHAPLKKLMFHLLTHRRQFVVPEFRRTYGELFSSLEEAIASKGKADFGEANDGAAFDFLVRAFFGAEPKDSKLGRDAPKLITKWIVFQLGPLLKIGLPMFVEELLLHSFSLPPALVRGDYGRLAEFFRDAAGPILDEAKVLGISESEAIHNIIFAVCFNTYGGMKILFSNLVKWIGLGGTKLHGQLAREVRAAVRDVGNGEVTMKAIESMPLVKSLVYESLRIEPPVALQYGRAKCDVVVESHDAAFEVKAGEMLFGYQPFATKDRRFFERADEFLAERFVGEDGERLLKYVVWSNGPENETPTTENKQCAGKDFVVLIARLLVVELFLNYDSFDVEIGTSVLGSSVKITALRRATF